MPDPARSLASDIGLIFLILAGLAATGLGVALGAGEPEPALGFFLTLAIGGAGGLVLRVVTRGTRDHDSRDAAPAVALAWGLAAVLAAVPFWTAGAGGAAGAAVFADPVNALFESMSGLTSTGLTVSPDASALPHALQWWRSLLQWVGGVGVLYVALALVPDSAGTDDLDAEKDTRDVGGRANIRAVWAIYAAYTVAAALAFRATGMPAWAAVNHAMTALSTGGFDVTGDSFAGYGQATRLVCAVAMVLGAMSFGVHTAVLLRGRVRAAVRDTQTRALVAMLGVGIAALILATRGEGVAMADAAFHWTSALTTAGFATEDVTPYGAAGLGLLIVAMVVGGAAGSTTGGLKQRRVMALLKRVTGQPEPRAAEALRQFGRITAALAAGTVALVVLGDAAPLDALFEAASALGTVGLSVGVTGPDLAAPARLVLVVLMWMGRLEIAAVLALLVRRRSPR